MNQFLEPERKDQSMKTFSAAIVFVIGAIASNATADTLYTNQNAFVAALGPGYYAENFSSLTPFAGPLTSLSFTGGTTTVRYQITAPGSGLFVNRDGSGQNAVGNYAQADSVVVNFSSPNVYAIGAQFYLSNLSGVNQNGTILLSFSDATAGSVPSSSTTTAPPYGFFGIIASTPITSMTIANNAAGFLNMTGLITQAGAPVPEPATGLMLLAGLAGVLRRK
jgi:hypothetical protein